MAGRPTKTEAVVLRSIRFGEADRVLHLYTLDRGRVGAVAKGVRKTKSRFGARLEPLSHVDLMLHAGSGELQTITGVELVHSHQAARDDYYRLSVGLIGAEAMLRLFTEQERNGFTNVYLDRVEPLEPGHTEGAAGGSEAEEVAWKTAIEAAPWLLGEAPKGGVEADELFERLQPFKELVAEDIRAVESNETGNS